MVQLPVYSTLFSCLHDEPTEYGSLGRGTHHSVFRCVEWLDVCRRPLAVPETHDFAIIWDEDHDTRVIEAVERIYMASLLSPVQFIGERKGCLTLIVAAKFYWEADVEDYKRQVEEATRPLDDHWPVEIGMFDRSPTHMQQGWVQTDPQGLISAETHRVNLYLANIDSLWKLGTRPYVWSRGVPPWPPLPPPSIPVFNPRRPAG